MTNILPIKLLHEKAKLPVYSTELAAGCDIFIIKGTTIKPDEIIGLKHEVKDDPTSPLIECKFNDVDVVTLTVKRYPAIFNTGISVQLEPDEELEIRGRSGLGFNYDIVPFNGTIDADFTGEIRLKVWNLGTTPYTVEDGMKLAQGVIKKVIKKTPTQTDTIKETERGDKGFASTGLF